MTGTGIAPDNGVDANEIPSTRPVTLFLCGDVMTGRGVDQILPCPSDPLLHEPYVQSALEYVAMAEQTNGPISKPVSFSYIWGDAPEELDRVRPAARIINLETSITMSDHHERKGINYRMHPANTPCLTAAKIVFAAGTIDSGIEPDWAATDSAPGIALLHDLSDETAALIGDRVAGMKGPGDIAVLSIHWGENWGYEIPRGHRVFTRKLIDLARIDVVHGHSSHHPKGIEIYKNKPIIYGCGDFLNDYEGIAGYEEFRSHLVLGYFATIDSSAGNLLRLAMAPFQIKNFRLQQASTEDAAWLRSVMTREGRPLGSQIDLDRNRLILTWQRSS